MNLIIRPALLTDANVICDFNSRMAKETENKDLDPATLKAGVHAMLSDPHKGRYFVAEEFPHPPPLSREERGDLRIVGQLGVTCEWSDWRNGYFWWVQSVYVVEGARRHGVFRKLYEHLLREARAESNVIGVRLYVEHDNQVAQATYQKLGMEMTGYQVMEMYPL
jgi:GNAT superfamily N-acetyltransferase